MHELVKNEKKEGKARPLLKTRTGLTSDSLSLEEKQRIAARADTATAQVLRRRRDPRSLLIWGGRKKVIIQRNPDGTQEINVPQSLTQEEQNYEFPPRSKFLITLASAPTDDSAMNKQPDPFALNEWFTKKSIRTTSKRPRPFSKDKAVMDWIKNVPSPALNTPPAPTRSNGSHKIQFKSDAGKRWANNITSNTSLQAPVDGCHKHYVPRRLLHQPKGQPPPLDLVSDAASKIQQIWKDYQHNQQYMETKVGLTAMQTTGERTPMAGMVHLVQMLHDSLKVQQQKSQGRLEKLEMLLQEETKKRVSAEDSIKKLDTRDLSSRKKLILEDSNKKVILKKKALPPARSKRAILSEKKPIERTTKGVPHPRPFL